MHYSKIIAAIDESPFNRGLAGCDWIIDPENVPIIEGDDIALFDGEGNGIFQVHMLYTSRGRAAVDFTKRAFAQMFEDRGATMIYGLTPVVNRPVIFMARWAGGKFAGKRSTPHGDCEIYVLTKEQWERMKN